MRRLALIGLTAGVLVVLAAVLGACGDDDEGYRVRAIFDNAAFLVKGEDVKVAGVVVGSIDGLSVTPENRAAVVLRITDPAYQDFRADASCTIRPQSLIGEQFVECSPTQQRASTDPLPPPLPAIREGDGKGQRLLPVRQTSAGVGLDLLGNIWRLPVRQRLTLILNEFGTGLAGRGEDLNAVLRRSAPALQDLNRVLRILADQNRTLEQLAVDSDRILAPLARDRRRLTGFIRASQEAAAATAERRDDLTTTLQLLPPFLRELRPTMQRLDALAVQGAPLAGDLRAAAPATYELLRRLGPFSEQATPALRSLGAVGDRGIPAIRATRPVVQQLTTLGGVVRPVAATLADVLRSFERNRGIPNLMSLIYYTALAQNGYDDIGHFLRAGLIVNTCTDYAVTVIPTCSSNFAAATTAAAAAAKDGAAAPAAARDLLREDLPAGAPEPPVDAQAPSSPTGGAAAPAAPPAAEHGDDASEAVMGYLFGEDAR